MGIVDFLRLAGVNFCKFGFEILRLGANLGQVCVWYFTYGTYNIGVVFFRNALSIVRLELKVLLVLNRFPKKNISEVQRH